jgi:predicted secreted protein
MTTARFCAALLAALCLAACDTIPPYWPIIPPELPAPRVVTDSVDGSSVDLVRTQLIDVRLPADSQSDNRWTFDLGKDRVLYPANVTPRFEDAQTEVFTFRAERIGTTSVRFTYHDPAQPQTPPVRTVAFEVVAR